MTTNTWNCPVCAKPATPRFMCRECSRNHRAARHHVAKTRDPLDAAYSSPGSQGGANTREIYNGRLYGVDIGRGDG